MGLCSIHIGKQSQSFTGTDQTRVFAVIGHPVSHSRSPVLQQAALSALGLDAVYLAIDVAPEELGASLTRMVAAAAGGRLGGVNVTSPHKQAVLARMGALEAVARQAGAVNVIGFDRSAGSVVLHGHNTDVEGLRAALVENGVSMAGVPVVVVGSGGMARAAVVAALRSDAAEIRVLARSPARAEAMLQSVATAWEGRLPALLWDSLEGHRQTCLADAAVLVQATSLGLQRHAPSPLNLQGAPPGMFVFESIYEPTETALLRQARSLGLAGANGLAMLLHQGAAALRLWTRREPPLVVMRQSLGLD